MYKNKNEDLRPKLELFLKENGLKVSYVASILDVNSDYISSYRNRKRDLGPKTLRKLENLMKSYQVSYVV